MRVCSIVPTPEFQYLYVHDVEQYARVLGSDGFNGRPLGNVWPEFECYSHNPLLAKGDFFGFTIGAFAMSQRATDLLSDLFLSVGELLPVSMEGERLYVLNITRFSDVLDPSRLVRKTLANKWIVGVERYAFIESTLRAESLFRIREEIGVLLTVTDHPDPKLDLRARSLQHGLLGLDFIPVSMA